MVYRVMRDFDVSMVTEQKLQIGEEVVEVSVQE